MAGIDRLKEADGIIEEFATASRSQMAHVSLEDRAYMLKLASTWALMDIAWSLRAIVLRTPIPK